MIILRLRGKPWRRFETSVRRCAFLVAIGKKGRGRKERVKKLSRMKLSGNFFSFFLVSFLLTNGVADWRINRPSKQGFRRSPNRARVYFFFFFFEAAMLGHFMQRTESGVERARIRQARLVEKKRMTVAASYWLHYQQRRSLFSWLNSAHVWCACECVYVARLNYSRQQNSVINYHHGAIGHGVEQVRGWWWRNWQLASIETTLWPCRDQCMLQTRRNRRTDNCHEWCPWKSTDNN